jgi:hypothetical protein
MTTKRHIRHKKCFNMSLCLFVALSFIAPLLPIANASSDTMPCCAGKAGHCDSGITPKRVPPPTSEPMCGLKEATMESDGITIVAEPIHSKSQHSHSRTAENSSTGPAVESASLRQPCHMDCGACATSSSRQQRERGLLTPGTEQTQSLTPLLQVESKPHFFSSNEDWEQISPRGPPNSSQIL